MDRAISLEQAFENAFEDATNSLSMKADFCTGYHSTGDAPLLLLNATDASSGQRVVLTPARITDDPDAIYPIQQRSSLHFSNSTAAFLSARFPFVSPAGEMDIGKGRRLSLVDGGYVDNTGTETIAAIVSELSDAASNSSYSLIILMPSSPKRL
jgi:hypothetical protein